jgi:hypothetical protein
MQTSHQWQQSPMQGTIPSIPTDEENLSVVQENLLDALSYLQFTHHWLESSGLSKQYTALFTAVSDGLNATNEAIERCSDSPD